MTDMPLFILLIESDPDRAARLAAALREAGASRVEVMGQRAGLAARVAALQPDVVLIDLDDPSRDALEELALAAGPLDRPVAMFVDRSDPARTRAAIEAGLSAYVVDGLRPERLRPILDAAIARFHLFRRMRTELETTRAALEDRKDVDRAKGILMRARNLGEDEAYALLRKTAMDQGRKLPDVARALILATEMLG